MTRMSMYSALLWAGLAVHTALAQEIPVVPPTTATSNLLEPSVIVEDAPRRERIWVGGEYLLWWVQKGSAPPPLATTAPANSTALVPGVLGQSDTSVLLGGQTLDYSTFSGARFTVGSWLDDEQRFGLEGTYFFLGEQSIQQSTSAGSFGAFLVNPFLDVSLVPPAELANFIAPITAGSATLTSTSRLQGAECTGLFNLWNGASGRLHLLTGFRFLNLRETLALTTTQTDPLASFFPGQFVNTFDRFSTQNYYYAGQVGSRFDLVRGRFFLNATGKVALGSMHEVVDIQGFTTTNTGRGFVTPVATTTVPGGIYAQPTNIGQTSRDEFAVAPEVTVQVGVQVRRLRLFVGYNFLYISEVARPGDQIDRAINSTQLVSFTGVPTGPLVGPARPAPIINGADFWAQGINFGLELRY